MIVGMPYPIRALAEVCLVLDQEMALHVSMNVEDYGSGAIVEGVLHEMAHLMTMSDEGFNGFIHGDHTLSRALITDGKSNDDGEVMANAVTLLVGERLLHKSQRNTLVANVESLLDQNVSAPNPKDLVAKALTDSRCHEAADTIEHWFHILLGDAHV